MPNPSQDQTLDQLLSDYRRNGVDSEGQFTINPARAREMLEQFQLPEPAYYALHFVSFLIGAGATSVSIEQAGGGLRFLAPGAQLVPAVAASPFSALLKSDVEPYLSELALGLNTILGQQARVELVADGLSALYTPDGIELFDKESCRFVSLTVSGGSSSGQREVELIGQHFALSPVPIQLAGVSLSQPAAWSPAVLQVALTNDAYPLPSLPDSPLHRHRSTRARLSAVLRVGRQASGVRVLHLGRLYTLALPWGCALPGWQVEVVLNTDRLRKDLTQQALRDNDTFKNMFAMLQQQLEMALSDLPVAAWHNGEAQALWDGVIEAMVHQGRKAQAVERQALLLRNVETAPVGPEKANALLRMGWLRNLSKAGSGAQNLQQAETILSRLQEPKQAGRIRVKTRMAFSNVTPELRSAVVDLATDPGAPPQERIEAYRWLREREQGDHEPALYSCRMAQLLYELGRSSLALHELDASPVSDDPRLLAALGHFERALESLGQLLALQREQYGQYSMRLGLTLTRLAAVLEHLGKTKQAEEYREWSQRLHQ